MLLGALNHPRQSAKRPASRSKTQSARPAAPKRKAPRAVGPGRGDAVGALGGAAASEA